jgi:hypothetical protein
VTSQRRPALQLLPVPIAPDIHHARTGQIGDDEIDLSSRSIIRVHEQGDILG